MAELIPVAFALVHDLQGAGDPCTVCGELSDYLDDESHKSYCEEHAPQTEAEDGA